jgi:hypothetical protein
VAVALYEYAAAEENELTFAEGERITHIEAASDDWWTGRNTRGEVGLFPGTQFCIVAMSTWLTLLTANYVELQ